MCPLWPLHIILMYLLMLYPVWVLCQNAPRFQASYRPDNIEVHMDQYEIADFNVTGLDTGFYGGDIIRLRSSDQHIAAVDYTYQIREMDGLSSMHSGSIQVNGSFLGRTEIVTEVVRGSEVHLAEGVITVNVTRPERIIDTIFTTSVATFVSLIFINFGCAMHWPTVKEVVKKPIGPAIGMVGQFLFMPLCSFGLGYLIFRDDSLTAAALRLGMFCTGVSPGGGASNIWTFILGGNLNLSLAMTSMSTLASFAFMPMWLFSLGQVIFRDARIVVPYTRIASFVVGLIVPMAIGLGMQRWTPRLAAFMVRILKGFSSLLLLFIIVFAIITNLYIFELFTWEIIVAGMGLPWLGYLFGYVFARALKQPHPDALAISIETGVQNTGIAIFLLRFALPQPDADLTTVVPVSVAIMTPVPMMTIFAYQKIKGCITGRNKHKKIVEEDNTPIPDTPEPISVATIAIEKEN